MLRKGFTIVRRQRGVAAVEMALIAPLLVILFLGAVEAAWLLGQSLDVRQASREGGRLAAVDYGDEVTIAAEACATMDDQADTKVNFAGAGGSLGDDIEVTVTKTANHLTTFLDWAFPAGMTISSSATFALEVSPPSWNNGEVSC